MTTTSAEPSTPSGSAAAPQRRRQITSYKSTTSSPATDRDGDPRFAPVALAGYTAADTPDPRVSLLRAPRLANLSPFCGLHPPVRCLRDEGDRTRRPCRAADVGSPPSGCGIDPRFFGIAQASPAGRSSAAARPGGFSGNAFCNKICRKQKSPNGTNTYHLKNECIHF